MYRLPEIEQCLDFARVIGCKRIEEVLINPSDNDKMNSCHFNSSYNRVTGYYFVIDSHDILHAFKHSVVDVGDRLIDVTPVFGDRKKNVFAYGTERDDEHITYTEGSVFINRLKNETEILYYVYALIDPRTDEPFYIGKGKDDRCLSHFIEHNLSSEGNNRKTSKIRKLKDLGFDPVIEFYAQNIEDEDLAYMIEEHYIKKHVATM